MKIQILSTLVGIATLLPFTAAIASKTPQQGDFNGCPPQGNTIKNTRLNQLKNRSTQFIGASQTTVAAINVLPTSPSSRINDLQSQMVFVEGYLVEIKQQGKESTNCGGTGNMADNHLWLVDEAAQVDLTNNQTIRKSKAKATVVEITPRWRASNSGWEIKTIQKLINQKAKFRITGWLMLDPEHTDQIGKTRGGIWEIHPITKIEVLSGNQWDEL
jgi:hypothetical protein